MGNDESPRQESVGSLSRSWSSQHTLIRFDEHCVEDTVLGYVISAVSSLGLEVRITSSTGRKLQLHP